ncbi:MAG: bifunctional diaminohydroxyphosphoribosylaminopyrimidine deaminase/5-amino-6-(5-phosphoribosylamino)uracil reductase RibD [Actinomycetota bacterium]|nr:bifunctional diaminohydroxyphosphoribosylaminopyrimidine deaminase/5-amino-6-(5-phosphoribosylamino)uracil reductase RibD [Actinomycetota bacterium]
MTRSSASDADRLGRAVELAAAVRAVTPPNPWVGCVIETATGEVFEGATEAAGGRHAEVVALDVARAAHADLTGASVWVTLEPCSHHGRTPPCAEALIEAGVGRVCVSIPDPDPKVAGQGLERLAAAGIEVALGTLAGEVEDQLTPYLTHRRTGRPYVVLKLAATLDGRTAAGDGTSQWITGAEARADAHALRAASDAVIVGAGTVRADDPSLTVRDAPAPRGDPVRVVLGAAPPGAKVHPCLERKGDLGPILDELGRLGHLQVLVEGGAGVAHAFHAAGLVDRYVVYLAPALLGGDDGRGLFAGPGAPTMASLARGRFVSVTPMGDDLRIDLVLDEEGR